MKKYLILGAIIIVVGTLAWMLRNLILLVVLGVALIYLIKELIIEDK